MFGPQTSHKNNSAASADDVYDNSGFVDDLANSTSPLCQDARATSEDGGASEDVFGVAALRSALPETNVKRPRKSFGGSRFTGSPSHNRSHGRHSGGPVHEENSLRGLHDRYVGLLGETFVSNSPTLFKQILIRHLDLRAFLDAAVQLGH